MEKKPEQKKHPSQAYYEVLRLLFLVPLLWLGPSCALLQSTGSPDYGMQTAHRGYIPTKIAVLPCQPRPRGISYRTLGQIAVKEEILGDLCRKFDEHILQSFSSQPFMRGITPRRVLNLLKEAKLDSWPTQLETLWAHRFFDCQSCDGLPEYYLDALPKRPEWVMSLQQLSKATAHSDAVLIPWILSAQEWQHSARGTPESARMAEIALLLVDSQTGELIWSGGRIAQKVVFGEKLTRIWPPFPEWQGVHDQLFSDLLWREFPGRQVR